MQGRETVAVHAVDVISLIQKPTGLLLVAGGNGGMEHHIGIPKAQFRLAAFHGEIGIVCGQLALVPSLLLLKSLLRRVGTMAEELAHAPLIRPLFGRRFPNRSLTQRLLDLDLTVIVPKEEVASLR